MAARSQNKKLVERVMVVARNDLFASGSWYGIRTDNPQKYLKIIASRHRFLGRKKVEDDSRWQQIIPYLVFEYNGQIFLMHRKSSHSDSRLSNLYSIGIGGHINKKDIREDKGVKGSNVIMEWAKREFAEEIQYEGDYKTEFLGLINDDSNEVGLVHTGLAIRVIGDSKNIKVKDEHKSGKLVAVSELESYYKRMETWSQIVYDFLMAKKNHRNNTLSNGVLPDWAITESIEKGIIQIKPLTANWRQKIDQVSIDFHLGSNIKLFRGGTYRFIDTRRGLPEDAMEEINLKEGDPFILEPGAFAIATTKELLKLPNDILGRLEGKSSLARLGILIHSTAARFDPGWNGAPVLELGNLGPKPAILYCGMAICAFTFEKLAGAVKMPYEGSRSDRYGGSKTPIASRIERHGKRGKKRK